MMPTIGEINEGRELDREICLALGWIEQKVSDYGYQLVKPDGAILDSGMSEIGLKSAWYRNDIPAYSSDLNDAWKLWVEHPRQLIIPESWLTKSPVEVARLMAQCWLYWDKAHKEVIAFRGGQS